MHTELLSDGIVELIRCGAVDNSNKSIDRGKTVASFCMGHTDTYKFIHDNPGVEFRSIEYTNNPMTIASIRNMTAINASLQIDLTGQATAESIGRTFYSGIGGQADFMRGAVLAPGGKTILTMRSTSNDGDGLEIVPFLSEGAGVPWARDVHYVVTDTASPTCREKHPRTRHGPHRIAHPKFRPWLIEEAKKVGLIYKDQAFIPGKKGEYPETLEVYRTTKAGLKLLLRPVRISDEPLLKDFFYSLSDRSIYRRFISTRKDMHHERLQEFVIIDYTREMVILAVVEQLQKDRVVGIAQYGKQNTLTRRGAVVISDDFQNKVWGRSFYLL